MIPKNLLKHNVCDDVSYVGKANIKFCYSFNNHECQYKAFRKGDRKFHQKLFHIHRSLDGFNGIEGLHFEIFEQCKTQAQWKEI